MNIKIEESRQLTKQFEEWNEVFEILSYCRKNNLSEIESHSILSNRFSLQKNKP